jgi:hypothetical protein
MACAAGGELGEAPTDGCPAEAADGLTRRGRVRAARLAADALVCKQRATITRLRTQVEELARQLDAAIVHRGPTVAEACPDVGVGDVVDMVVDRMLCTLPMMVAEALGQQVPRDVKLRRNVASHEPYDLRAIPISQLDCKGLRRMQRGAGTNKRVERFQGSGDPCGASSSPRDVGVSCWSGQDLTHMSDVTCQEHHQLRSDGEKRQENKNAISYTQVRPLSVVLRIRLIVHFAAVFIANMLLI